MCTAVSVVLGSGVCVVLGSGVCVVLGSGDSSVFFRPYVYPRVLCSDYRLYSTRVMLETYNALLEFRVEKTESVPGNLATDELIRVSGRIWTFG